MTLKGKILVPSLEWCWACNLSVKGSPMSTERRRRLWLLTGGPGSPVAPSSPGEPGGPMRTSVPGFPGIPGDPGGPGGPGGP